MLQHCADYASHTRSVSIECCSSKGAAKHPAAISSSLLSLNRLLLQLQVLHSGSCSRQQEKCAPKIKYQVADVHVTHCGGCICRRASAKYQTRASQNPCSWRMLETSPGSMSSFCTRNFATAELYGDGRLSAGLMSSDCETGLFQTSKRACKVRSLIHLTNHMACWKLILISPPFT